MSAGVPADRGVVVHLSEDDPAKQANVMANIANLLAELGQQTPVELVVHGPGLSAALASAAHADVLAGLIGRGVGVAACGNTMRARSVGEVDLLAGVHIVPAGVAQLVRRQREGWAYLRP